MTVPVNFYARRMCSFCGRPYTDDSGHDYDLCVKDLEIRLAKDMKHLSDTRLALEGARSVQAQSWWRGKLKGVTP